MTKLDPHELGLRLASALSRPVDVCASRMLICGNAKGERKRKLANANVHNEG